MSRTDSLSQMVWHYSVEAKLLAIVESGELRAGNAGADGEKPMLWFSANQQWEPTATKPVCNDRGEVVRLTLERHIELFGRIRFGLNADDTRLMDWKSACMYAGTPRQTRRALVKVGKKQGGDSAQWFATSVSILLPELHFQVWNKGWDDTANLQDIVRDWEEHRSN